MPNKSGSGLRIMCYDDAHRPLAVIEAKKTCADVASGRAGGVIYADSWSGSMDADRSFPYERI